MRCRYADNFEKFGHEVEIVTRSVEEGLYIDE